MLYNFSYVVDGCLAGSAMPGVRGSLDAALRDARNKGISAIVTLTEDGLAQAALEAHQIRWLHLPVEDYAPPSLEQIETFVHFVDQHQSHRSGAVLVHCYAGQGRAGTMLACYLVHQGWEPVAAIERIRTLRPRSIESHSQEFRVREWAHLRHRR